MTSEALVFLKKRAEKVWELDNLEKLEKKHLSSLDLSGRTIEALCSIGLPKWCAPNMHFHPRDGFAKYCGETNGIHIGVDRDELLICLHQSTEMIYALNFDGKSFSVARNIEEFLYLLVTYAEFIDGHLSANPKFDFSSEFPDIDSTHDLISNLQAVSSKPLQDYDWWAKHLEILTNQNPNYHQKTL